MRAPRSLLLLLGGTALVVGAVLAFAEYSDAGIPCDRPASGVFRTEARPGLRIDPDHGIHGRYPCVGSARWRLGGGAMLLVAGAAALVVWTRQSRLGHEPGGPPTEGTPP